MGVFTNRPLLHVQLITLAVAVFWNRTVIEIFINYRWAFRDMQNRLLTKACFFFFVVFLCSEKSLCYSLQRNVAQVLS